MTASAASHAAERAAREAYGKLVSWLAWRWRDLAAAEDAMGDALVAALLAWPRQGVPANPEAWLLTAARNRLREAARHRKVVEDPAVAIVLEGEEAPQAPAVADERLRLLFTCAHPGIEPAMRTPLMLQAVLGMEAARIGSSFLASPAAMSQRLVRAKARIRAEGLAFEPPDADELPGRLHAVLEAIYAAYGSDWDDGGATPGATGLAEEAIWLARLVVAQLPHAAEAWGLLALLLHCEARRAARRAGGAYVPLEEQDVAHWDATGIAEAEACLRHAHGLGAMGPFQLEAAIQSAHAERRRGGATPWPAIAHLYAGLVALAPTLGARVAHAAALARSGHLDAARAVLAELAPRDVATYQPYWAVRAWIARHAGNGEAAVEAYGRAIGLTEDPAVRRWLQRQADGVPSRTAR